MSKESGFYLIMSVGILWLILAGGVAVVGSNHNVQMQKILTDLRVELGASDAIIESPAIIKCVETLTEFKVLQSQLNTSVYFYESSFYLIPDSYMGYIWTPEIPPTLFGEATLTNR